MYIENYFQLVSLNSEILEISKHLNIFGTTTQYYTPHIMWQEKLYSDVWASKIHFLGGLPPRLPLSSLATHYRSEFHWKFKNHL